VSALGDFRENDGLRKWERWTEWPLLILGLLFLVVILLPLATPLSQSTQAILDWLNWTLWAVFAVDYFVRLYLALERWHFIKTHVLDLVIVVVPAFRALRVLRLISVLTVSLRRTRDLNYLVLPVYVGAITAVLVGVSAVLVYDAEGTNPDSPITTLGDAVWWAFTTVTTVGYGDEYPVTPLGRTLGVLLMMSGIALIGSLTASAAAWLTNTRRTAEEVSEGTDNSELLAEIRALRAEVAELREERARNDDLTVPESATRVQAE
jgi:voltage-gated potassium channel